MAEEDQFALFGPGSDDERAPGSRAPSGEPELTTARCLLMLMSMPGVGSARAIQLAQRFGTWDALLSASPGEVRAAIRADVAVYRPAQPADVPEGITLVGYFEPTFPAVLRTISNPPAALWIRGNLAPALPAVAVVGARETSSWGSTMADSIGFDCATAGVTVVSGLAFGVDVAAHRGALRGGGHTVAVLGSGVDVPTPREHLGEAERILAGGGALVSELAPGAPATPHTLVARNRLQTGLSQATVVVQCGVKSGTLHTAKFAAVQGRRLLVPTPPDHESDDVINAGSQALLNQGVTLRGTAVHAERLTSRQDFQQLLHELASTS